MFNYSKWLRDALVKSGLSQAELARRMDVDPSKVTRWLKDERGFKGPDIDRIAEILNAPIPGARVPRANSVPPNEEVGMAAPVTFTVAATAIADEHVWRENSMTTPSLARYPLRGAVLHPQFGPEDQYYVPLQQGISNGDPNFTAEYVICVRIEKLDRKVRPADWVHVKLRQRGGKLVKDIVREVVMASGQLVLRPLRPGTGLEDIPLSEAELQGLVLTHQLDRRV